MGGGAALTQSAVLLVNSEDVTEACASLPPIHNAPPCAATTAKENHAEAVMEVALFESRGTERPVASSKFT